MSSHCSLKANLIGFCRTVCTKIENFQKDNFYFRLFCYIFNQISGWRNVRFTSLYTLISPACFDISTTQWAGAISNTWNFQYFIFRAIKNQILQTNPQSKIFFSFSFWILPRLTELLVIYFLLASFVRVVLPEIVFFKEIVRNDPGN